MTADELIHQVKREQAAIRRVLVTGDGKLLLSHLERRFERVELVGKTVTETYQNLGRLDVVRLLQRERDALGKAAP